MYDEPVRMKPTFYIDDSQLPELRNMQLGEEYEVVMRIKPTNLNQSDSRILAEFTVVEIIVPQSLEEDINLMTNDEFIKYAKKKKRADYKGK